MIPVTSLYIALCALFLVYISIQVVRQRYRTQISIHGYESPELGRAIRAQGNFVEYVPMILLLMAGCELSDGSIYILHLAGILLLVSRILHYYSLTKVEPVELSVGNKTKAFRFRMAGMIITFSLLGLLGIWLLLINIQRCIGMM